MTSRLAIVLFCSGLIPAAAFAQAPVAAPAAVQVAAAVAPLPEQFRADATVLGYSANAKGLIPLRNGTGPYTCLADDPSDGDRFHVACYHKSLEPFMLRGRQLRAQGVTNVDSARNAEIAAGTLEMPRQPMALYSFTGKQANVDAAGAVSGAQQLYVVYIPFATAESTGLPTRPSGGGPWLMGSGTPKAHIMFTTRM
ncbi:MAG TPA: hypothetical protein VK864_18940 [Longimicrobiales bacterium]|nr:hypothetical protein [Longimicrobiales bacterium]